MRKIKDWDVEESLNTSTVQCNICDWYTNHALEDDVTGKSICPSCADDILYMTTGCRFGTPAVCDPHRHSDCHM